MTLNTIVFDLGGTLIEYAGEYDSWPDLETPGFRAAYAFLQQEMELPPFARFRDTGFSLLPLLWRQAQRTTANFRVVDLLTATLNAVGAGSPNGLVDEAAAQYTAAIQAQAWLIPDARETLAAVKEAGFKIGLVSNTMFPGKAHQEDLIRFGLADFFDTMLFSADENKWKPTPDPFLHVLEALQERGETAVYIGDDPASDVVGAQSAGMRAIYYRSSNRFALPADVKPDAAVTALPELPDLLQSWRDAHGTAG